MADPKTTAAELAAKAAEQRRLLVSVRLLDATETSLSKIIQAAITAYSNETQTRVADAIPESEQPSDNTGWQWVAILDTATCPVCESLDESRWTKDFEPVGDSRKYEADPPLHYGCRCSIVPVDLEEPAAENLTFTDWLAQYSRSEQDSMFGKTTMKLYRNGTIKESMLVRQKERMLSLEQFKKME